QPSEEARVLGIRSEWSTSFDPATWIASTLEAKVLRVGARPPPACRTNGHRTPPGGEKHTWRPGLCDGVSRRGEAEPGEGGSEREAADGDLDRGRRREGRPRRDGEGRPDRGPRQDRG